MQVDLAKHRLARHIFQREIMATDHAACIMGWKAKANQELIGRLRRRLTEVPWLEFVKVAGHAGVPENERCDELARQAIVRRGVI